MGRDAPPFVFVTVGTDHHPFHRLIQWVDGWLAGRDRSTVRCLLQTGTSEPPRLAEHAPYLSYAELEKATIEADVVVAHAGSGTVQMCRRLGRKPIVIPRRGDLGEHVDEHQVRFARRMAAEGYVELAEDETTFQRLVDAVLSGELPSRVPPPGEGAREVILRFGELVDELIDEHVPRTRGASLPARVVRKFRR